MDDCIVVKKNLGLSRCNKLPALPRCMIVTPPNFKVLAANLVTQELFAAAIQAAMLDKANRIYLFPEFAGFEDNSSAPVYDETYPVRRTPVLPGQYRFKFSISENMCLHKNMYTHRATKGRVMIFDNENQLLGMLNSAGDFMGLSIGMINPENMIISNGAVSTKSPVQVDLSNSNELNTSGHVIAAPFVNELNRLTDVTLELVGAAAAAQIVVKVYASCDKSEVSGLVAADFKLLDDAGAVQAIQAAVENPDGTYTLTPPVAFVDGSLTLQAAEVLSIEAYEAENTLVINVP